MDSTADESPEGTPIHYLPPSAWDAALLVEHFRTVGMEHHLSGVVGIVRHLATSTNFADVTCQQCRQVIEGGTRWLLDQAKQGETQMQDGDHV